MSDSFLDKIKGENKVVKTALILNVCFYFMVSLISMVCSVDLYKTFHTGFIPYLTSFSFELGQVVALFSLSVLSKQNKTLTYIMFVVLTFFQIIANTFSGYHSMVEHPSTTTLSFFKTIMNLFGVSDTPNIITYSAFLFVGMLPIIPLLSIKSLINYLSPDNLEDKNKVEIEDEIVVNTINDNLTIIQDNNTKIDSLKTDEVIENKPEISSSTVIENVVEEVKKKNSRKKQKTKTESNDNIITPHVSEQVQVVDKRFDISDLENYNKTIIENVLTKQLDDNVELQKNLTINPEIIQRTVPKKQVIVSTDNIELI